MSAVVIALPQTRRGRRSVEQQRIYQDELDQFAARILELNSTLEFQVSSRGWCYILEEHGLNKGDFDRAQHLLNDCRKSGRLPLDICKEDDSRAISGMRFLFRFPDSPEEWAQRYINKAKRQVATAFDEQREKCGFYDPILWEDGLEYALFVLVEKVDLVTLFQERCSWSRVPIANAKGWCDLHLRAAIMRYFRDAEQEGRTPVLLYCGDHDPPGLLISDTLRKSLDDLKSAQGVNWSPDNLIVDRFGLNKDFIDKHRLSWIPNLQTGKGGDLADPDHDSHYRAYVQNYLRDYGPRKVEANVLVTRPDAARQLITSAIHKYIPEDWETRHIRRLAAPRAAALAAFDRLRKAPP